MRTVGAPGMRVGPNAKRHTRGCPGSSGAPCHSNTVDCRPISGGGSPSRLPTVKRATAQDAPTSRAAPKAAITVSQNRRAKLDSSVGAPGFEPGTFWSQTRRATGLRYAPLSLPRHNLTLSAPSSNRLGVHETVHGRSRLHLAEFGRFLHHAQRRLLVILLVAPRQRLLRGPPTSPRPIRERPLLPRRHPAAAERMPQRAVLFGYLRQLLSLQQPPARLLISHGPVGIGGRREQVRAANGGPLREHAVERFPRRHIQ